MSKLRFIILVLVSNFAWLSLVGCVTHRRKPCSEGGQPARESNVPFQGTKKCYQITNSAGQVVNEGKYLEWYMDDKLALTGEYKAGKKTGRWIEYDQKGNKISDRFFEEGKEIPHP